MKRTRDDEGGKRDAYGEDKRERLTTNDALSYLREVKTRFANNRKVYDSFLEIMKQFKAQSIDTTGVIGKVKTLFHGHPELILGFNTFLPKGYEIRLDDINKPNWQAANKAPVEFDQAITYVNKIKQRFSNDERVYKAFLEILNMYRKGQKTIANVYDEVALLFRSHDDLLAEFTYFLPDNSPPAVQPRRTAVPAQRRPGMGGAYGAAAKTSRRALPPLRKDDPKVQRELAFFEKVKQRLRNNREAYTDFLKCLNLFAEDVVTKQELVSLVHDIIGRHHDLMAGLNEFLMRCELGPDDPYSRPYQARDRSRHANLQQKYISLPISELDVATWERTTPSYVMLPAGYTRMKTTGRDEVGSSVLNDDWVSVTSGSEDYNFKHYRKNQYEDFLFMAEDDHFELDMVIDQNSSAIKHLQPLADEIAALSEEDRANWVLPEGALRAFHFRAVWRIYGEAGPQMVALLRQNPAVAIPTILPRLIQKQTEWSESKDTMMKQWQNIFKENYNKSLDHRSFYFKQNEKKNLTPKLLFNELKEVADKRRLERVAIMLALTGRVEFSARLSPHLTIDYSDVEVQQDTARIVQMGIDNMLTADAAAKVRSMHHAFMETFFELVCTCGEAEERRKAAADDVTNPDAGAPPVGTTPRAARALKAAVAPESTDMDGGGEEDEEGGLAALKGLAAGDEPETATEAETSEDEGGARGAAGVGGNETAGAAEEEEEADETDYVYCRPVVPWVAGMTAPSPPTPSPGPDGRLHPHCRVFYGNESLYVLFRLHQILFDRLRAARQCSAQKAADGDGSAGPASASEIHAQFMTMCRSLIEGRTDPSAYEDDCRSLLGTSSYQLFTIDKLVQKVVKHAQACLAEDSTARLVELWKYENARGVPALDAVYHANARIVLGDEAAIRFEHTAQRMMTIQYMEAERGEPTVILEPAFREYVGNYVDAEQTPAPGTLPAESGGGGDTAAAPVCLQRNLAKAGAKFGGGAGGVDAEEVAAAALVGTARVNGLECKLGFTTQQRVKKIAYVLGTEDYYSRKKRKVVSSGDAVAGKAEKFQSWLAEKIAANAAAAAAEAAEAPAAAAVAAVATDAAAPAAVDEVEPMVS